MPFTFSTFTPILAEYCLATRSFGRFRSLEDTLPRFHPPPTFTAALVRETGSRLCAIIQSDAAEARDRRPRIIRSAQPPARDAAAGYASGETGARARPRADSSITG